MSKAMSLREAAGQVLLVGLEGPQLSATETAWLRLLRPGGVILFRRNIESPAQTHALLQATRQLAAEPQFRCVDVEGGTVDRLRNAIAPMPSAFAVAATHKPSLFQKHGALIGQAVHLLGFNTTFAPVLDLRTAASAEVMTSRVVSEDPEAVVAYARQFLAGLAKAGVLGSGKHFPGLGSGQVDSHHATPTIDLPLSTLWQQDLLPYRRLAKQLPMVMLSHAAYPAAVPEPASISRYWITEVLLRELKYRGLVISDDMEMGGILTYMGMAEAAVRALEAGTHVVEICRDPALIFSAYEALLREAESSKPFARILLRAADAVRAFKIKKLKKDALPAAPTAAAVTKMRSAVERFAAQVGTPT
jgi:beta-N-acetylhexosaminidase